MTPPNVPAGKPFPPRISMKILDTITNPVTGRVTTLVVEAAYDDPEFVKIGYLSDEEHEHILQEQRMEAAREAESALLEEIYLALRTERNTHGIGFTETDEGKGYRFGTMKMMDKFMELKKAKAAGVKNET